MNLKKIWRFVKNCFFRVHFRGSAGRLTVFLLVCGLLLTACGEETLISGTVYGLSDLPGKRVGVLADSQADLYSTDLELPADNQEPSVIVRYQSLDEAVDDLKTGTLDCIIMDASSAEKYCNENKHLVTLEEAFSWQEYSICLGADQAELTDTLNQALAILEENGTLKKISDRYITTENSSKTFAEAGFMEAEPSETAIETKKEADFPEETDPVPTLHAVTSSGFQPYVYYDENGELTGMDIDIAHALAEYLNMDILITDTDYQSLFTSVTDGSADFAIAGISPSEELSETCLFTDTYTTACQMVLVRE